MKKCILITANGSGVYHVDSPNLGIYRLHHLAKKCGYDSKVFDAGLININDKIKEININDYDIIGMAVSQDEMEEDLNTLKYILDNRICKKPLIIAGGLEATFNGERWLREGVEIILTGLAEDSFYKTLKYFSRLNFDMALKKVKELDGIMYLEKNEVIFKPNKILNKQYFKKYNHDLVLDMDIPYKRYWNKISKELFRLQKYKKFVVKNVRLYTSSACPYNCGFCNTSSFITSSQRKKHIPIRLTSKQVYEQILYHIKKYGAKSFVFNDDEPLFDKRRMRELSIQIINAKRRGIIPKDISFNSMGRVTDFLCNGIIDYDFIKSLKDMGFNSIGLGVETFTDRLLSGKSINKRGFNSKQSLEVLNAINDSGITAHAYTIIFVPESTRNEVKDNIRTGLELFKKGIKVNVNNIMIARPNCPIYSSYKYTTKTIKSKISGKEIILSDYFIPFDKFLARCASKVNDLYYKEIYKFQKRWGKSKIPKEVLGILNYLASAKLIKDRRLVNECQDILKGVLNKTK